MEKRAFSSMLLSSCVACILSLTMAQDVFERCQKDTFSADQLDVQIGQGAMYLQVYEADIPQPSAGPVLTNGTTYCPTTHETGFSIYCKGTAKSAKFVQFSVDGVQGRKETLPPYTINGDLGGSAFAWDDYSIGKTATIRCESDEGDYVEVPVTFECTTTSPPSSTKESLPAKKKPVATVENSLYLQVVKANVPNGAADVVLENGMELCPTKFQKGFSIFCMGVKDSVETVKFYKDGALIRTERHAPYAIGGNIGEIANSWNGYRSRKTESVIRCEASDGRFAEVTVSFTCK